MGDESRSDRVAREDLILFINACFASTGQREFYEGRRAQQVSIDFLHRYVLGNYRRLYARTLAVGVNHFNQALIIQNLLAEGSPPPGAAREEENRLITAAVAALPPQRVYRLFEALRRRRVNNRRTRAVMKRYLLAERDITFDAVKYRRRVRLTERHAHIRLDDETRAFLGPWQRAGQRPEFATPIYQTYVEARYSDAAVFELPFTVAEGIAKSRNIDRRRLLTRSKRLTDAERLRVQGEAARSKVQVDHDLARVPLTRLAVHICNLPDDERVARSDELGLALQAAADRSFARAPAPLGRVAVIADRSFSSSGSVEKRRRPLAVTLAAVHLLRRAARECHIFWAPALDRPSVEVMARGQTDLTTPLLAALRTEPDEVIIVSDGYENAPAGLVGQVVAAARDRVPGLAEVSFVHVNPVFDADNLAPRPLGPSLPTVGVRNAEDLLTTLGFARFADGSAPLTELEAYLETQALAFVEGTST